MTTGEHPLGGPLDRRATGERAAPELMDEHALDYVRDAAGRGGVMVGEMSAERLAEIRKRAKRPTGPSSGVCGVFEDAAWAAAADLLAHVDAITAQRDEARRSADGWQADALLRERNRADMERQRDEAREKLRALVEAVDERERRGHLALDPLMRALDEARAVGQARREGGE